MTKEEAGKVVAVLRSKFPGVYFDAENRNAFVGQLKNLSSYERAVRAVSDVAGFWVERRMPPLGIIYRAYAATMERDRTAAPPARQLASGDTATPENETEVRWGIIRDVMGAGAGWKNSGRGKLPPSRVDTPAKFYAEVKRRMAG
jgi:HAMP domain-containing protein|tara:strand:+ start:323 stop:757 length:435 start_codon:yes stop_codon:yes gene_type:complete